MLEEISVKKKQIDSELKTLEADEARELEKIKTKYEARKAELKKQLTALRKMERQWSKFEPSKKDKKNEGNP